MLVAGERGDDAKLYLRVVGGKQRVVVVAGDEGFADLASALGADGYVLQVGIAGAESSGSCNCLIENGMQTAVGGRDEFWERVEVGTYQLGERAVVQNQRHYGVFGGEFLQHVLGGGVLLGGGTWRLVHNLQFLEKHFAELLWRVDVETASGVLIYLVFNVVQLFLQRLGILSQVVGVDTHALALHAQKHIDERKLHIAEKFFVVCLRKFLFKKRIGQQKHLRRLTGVLTECLGILFDESGEVVFLHFFCKSLDVK